MKERDRLHQLRQKRTAQKSARQPSLNVARGSYRQALLQAGFRIPPILWFVVVLFFATMFTVLLSNGIGFIVGGVGGLLLVWFYARPFLLTRAELRRRAVVPELAPFADCYATVLKRERDVVHAFWLALEELPAGSFQKTMLPLANDEKRAQALPEILKEMESRFSGEEVASLSMTIRAFSNSHKSLSKALTQLAGRLRESGKQFTRIGARAHTLQVMFAVILFLFVVIPFSLIIIGREYFAPAFADSGTTQIMQLALVTQLGCVILLERIVMERL